MNSAQTVTQKQCTESKTIWVHQVHSLPSQHAQVRPGAVSWALRSCRGPGPRPCRRGDGRVAGLPLRRVVGAVVVSWPWPQAVSRGDGRVAGLPLCRVVDWLYCIETQPVVTPHRHTVTIQFCIVTRFLQQPGLTLPSRYTQLYRDPHPGLTERLISIHLPVLQPTPLVNQTLESRYTQLYRDAQPTVLSLSQYNITP